MKLKHINESILPISNEQDKIDVVAAADITMADEIASQAAEKENIKKEMEPVDKQTAAIAKETCPEEKPAKILEVVNNADLPNFELAGDYERLVKMMKSIRDIITCSNENFIKAAREACRTK